MSSGTRNRGQKHQNRVPFVAKRDIKRTDTDRERELAIKHVALQNICRRCAQKVQWRFQMGKYKKKKAGTAGRCNQCTLQRVRLAYRSVCDVCAKEKNLCPGCNRNPEDAELLKQAREREGGGDDGEDHESEHESEDESE